MEGGCGCADVNPGSEVINRIGKVLAASVSPKFALCVDPLNVQQQLINIRHMCMVGKMKGSCWRPPRVNRSEFNSIAEAGASTRGTAAELAAASTCAQKVSPGARPRLIDFVQSAQKKSSREPREDLNSFS